MKNDVAVPDTHIPRFGEFVYDPKTRHYGMVWAAKYSPGRSFIIGSELKLSDGRFVDASEFMELQQVSDEHPERLKAIEAGTFPFGQQTN